MEENNWWYDPAYPAIDDLVAKAKSRIPSFAFDYLHGGCNEDVNLQNNTSMIRTVSLKPRYIREHQPVNLEVRLFGHTYDAPFGVAPIGLQGLIWPGTPEILARAAMKHNLPFILSTVTTAAIETIGEITQGRAWYQLYHPADNTVTDNLLQRLEQSGYDVLVVLCDVPSFGFRPRDIRNGLSMPPRYTLSNFLQAFRCPAWSIATLRKGLPEFATIKPYMKEKMNLGQLGRFMNQTFEGRITEDKLKRLRDKWKGKLVLKGVASEEDAQLAVAIGCDGLIVSNHGGRQLDAAEPAIESLQAIVKSHGDRLPVMMDSGIRSGIDIARVMACGAAFTFMGRSFMYSVAALGDRGGDHMMGMCKTQLRQVLQQTGCSSPLELPTRLIDRHNKV